MKNAIGNCRQRKAVLFALALPLMFSGSPAQAMHRSRSSQIRKQRSHTSLPQTGQRLKISEASATAFSRAASRFSPRFSMRSLDAAACSCWLFCRNFDFGTLCPEVPDAPGSCSEPAPKAEPPGSAAPPPGSVCVWASGRGLFGFRFILHILRSGG